MIVRTTPGGSLFPYRQGMPPIEPAAWVATTCLDLPDATVDQPFGPGAEAYRVRGRIFALVMTVPHVSDHLIVNLKAQPDEVPLLIANHEFVLPGYHMNKKHWVSVEISPAADRALVAELIEDSYDAVAAKGRARPARAPRPRPRAF